MVNAGFVWNINLQVRQRLFFQRFIGPDDDYTLQLCVFTELMQLNLNLQGICR